MCIYTYIYIYSLGEETVTMITDEGNMMEIQATYPNKTADEASNISDQIVGILIKAVIEAGIVSEDFHAHVCFSQGILYKDYVITCDNEDHNCDNDDNNCDEGNNNCDKREQLL
jgi:hypothetical protein